MTDNDQGSEELVSDSQLNIVSIGASNEVEELVHDLRLARKNLRALRAGREEMRGIGKLLNTQDNRADENPMFAVRKKVRDCGMDSDYTDKYFWYDGPNHEEPSDEEVERLEALDVEEDGDTHKIYYVERWEFVQAFFTEAAAQRYIDGNKHNLGETGIYAYSAYRNYEWIAVRKFLKGLDDD